MTPSRRLAFRLCLALGWPHPDYLLHYLTAEQWAEWQQFDEEEPLGEWRSDARTAAIVQIIARTMGGAEPDVIIHPQFPYVLPKIDADAAMDFILQKNAEERRDRERAASAAKAAESESASDQAS